MSLSWAERKDLLGSLLQTLGHDDEEEGLALDRILHGQSIVGKTGECYFVHDGILACFSNGHFSEDDQN